MENIIPEKLKLGDEIEPEKILVNYYYKNI